MVDLPELPPNKRQRRNAIRPNSAQFVQLQDFSVRMQMAGVTISPPSPPQVTVLERCGVHEEKGESLRYDVSRDIRRSPRILQMQEQANSTEDNP